MLLSLWVLFWPDAAGPRPDVPGADKVVHLLLFALLAVTTRWRFGGARALLAALAAYAAVSEVVQARLLVDRSGDPVDVVADVAGAVLGWAVAGRRRNPR